MRTQQACGRCGTPLRGRFCTECGAPGAAGPPRGRIQWLVAGAAAVLALVLVAVALPEARARAAGEARAVGALNPAGGAAVPPDIGAMTPRERFDRLYARALEAAQSGDEAAAAQFTPMALAAYQMLDSVDADARYHAALLHLHAGRAGPARLLADTILQDAPGHLFGYLVRATAARWERDDAALRAAYREFLAQEPAELARGRPEYDLHRTTLDETARRARETFGAGP